MASDLTIIDLTHTITPGVPTFDGSCGFHLHVSTDYSECRAPNLFRVQKLEANAGIGTHIDAPAHCFPGAASIEALDLQNLVTDCVVIRVEEECHETYCIGPESVLRFEEKFGRIEPGSFVIFYTGWDRLWDAPEKYRNNNKYPSVHFSTAELLLEREISGLGTDTLSADSGTSDFPVHRLILGAGKYLVENIASAGLVPEVGAQIFMLPMEIAGGTEAPVRMVAVV